MGEFDATIAAAGYRDSEATQEHASQKKRGGSQLSRDQKNKIERTHESRERIGWGASLLSRDQNKKIESTWEQKKKGLGESQLSQDSNITNKGHMRCNKWANSMQR